MKIKGLLFGVGVGAGSGPYSAKNYPNEYKHWHSMLGRCYYYDNYKNKASVCKEWHNFENFCNWVISNPWYGPDKHLDKDVIVKGNREYGPDACAFIPRRINNAFTERTKEGKILPIGVSRASTNKFKCRYYDSNGTRKQVFGFDTPEDAFKSFCLNKERVMKELAEIYKHDIDPRVYDSLINFKQD